MTELNISENGYKVLHKRYLLKDKQGNVKETPNDLFRRVAKHVSGGNNEWEEKFYNIMTSLKFVPNSPTLTGAGRDMCLSACFVINPEDNIDSIFETQKKAATIFKEGGGVGYDFSSLRPSNSRVKTTQGISSGPISFMKSYDAMCHAIKQGGVRRGAQMGMLRVDHPDIEEFITSKDKENKILSNFNISVAITNKFMEAVENDSDFILTHPNSSIKKTIKAKELLRMIAENAHDTGDPGLFFIDRANFDNPIPHMGDYKSTNPCGELPLLENSSCNLGSIDVCKYYNEEIEDLNWDELKNDIYTCVKFLDQVIETNKYPLPEIDRVSRGERRIGLGIMGWAQLLFKLKIPYSSKQSIQFVEKFMTFFRTESIKASIILGKELGSFPFWRGSSFETPENLPPIFSDFISNNSKPIVIRNATQNTIAPTGSISLIANCSSGMEPVYALVFIKEVMDGTKLYYIDPVFKKIAEDEGFYSEELIDSIYENGGSCQGIDSVPKKYQRLFVTAMDLTPKEHVVALATFQKFIDSSISKTINLSSTATIEDIEEVYQLAFDLGCKGVTVYRDGCKNVQVLYTGSKENRGRSKIGINENILKKLLIERKMSVEEAADVFDCSPSTVRRRMKEFGFETLRVRPSKLQRPDILPGTTQKLKTGEGNFLVTANTDPGSGDLFEIIIEPSKTSLSELHNCEALGRLVSLARQYGVPVEEISEQLVGITGSNPTFYNGVSIKSLPDAIGKILYRFSDKGEIEISEGLCKSCGSENVEFSSGCSFCRDCGDGKCG